METCTWTYDYNFDNGWETGCGHVFVIYDGTPSDNGMKFCCFCGKPLIQVCKD